MKCPRCNRVVSDLTTYSVCTDCTKCTVCNHLGLLSDYGNDTRLCSDCNGHFLAGVRAFDAGKESNNQAAAFLSGYSRQAYDAGFNAGKLSRLRRSLVVIGALIHRLTGCGDFLRPETEGNSVAALHKLYNDFPDLQALHSGIRIQSEGINAMCADSSVICKKCGMHLSICQLGCGLLQRMAQDFNQIVSWEPEESALKAVANCNKWLNQQQ